MELQSQCRVRVLPEDSVEMKGKCPVFVHVWSTHIVTHLKKDSGVK